jgi:hypothetical protein
MKLYKDKWDPDLFRQSIVELRQETVLRQARERAAAAAELEAIDRELAALDAWTKETDAT